MYSSTRLSRTCPTSLGAVFAYETTVYGVHHVCTEMERAALFLASAYLSSTAQPKRDGMA